MIVGPLLAVLFLPAAAQATPVCNTDFCVSEDLTATSNPAGLIAAAPVTVDFQVANTSSNTAEDHWLQSATLTLADNTIASPPTLTASDQLQNNLLLAGGGSCTGPDYTDCPGGHGTLVGVAHTALGDVSMTGAFGIQKIVNINPSAAGAYGDYEITILAHACFNAVCFGFNSPQQVTIPDPPAGLPAAASFSLVTASTGNAIPGNLGTFDFALSSFSFHVDGQSNQLDGGPADQTYTILALPRDCGTATGSSHFTSLGNLTVNIPQSLTITGCPTAALAAYTLTGTSVGLDGSGSSTPVTGRTITAWHWNFGDGTTQVTATPKVNHLYQPGSTHTVSLVVEDSAGARSASVSEIVKVPATLKVTRSGTGSGTVTSSSPGISCGSVCSHVYAPGTSVVLTAKPATGSGFKGWSGACTGTGKCTVLMTQNRSVTATFLRDGVGAMATKTVGVSALEQHRTISFVYTAATGGMSNGRLSLTVPSGWSAPSLLGTAPGFVRTSPGMVTVSGRTIVVSNLTRAIGQTVTITYGSRTGGGPGATAPSATGPQTWLAAERSTASGTLKSLSSSPGITVYARDGSGLMTTPTTSVVHSSTGKTISFTYTAATGGMLKGEVTLVVPSGWSAPSLTGTASGFVKASTGTLAVSGRTILVSNLTRAAGQKLTISYGSKAAGGPGATAPSSPGVQTWLTKEDSTLGGLLSSVGLSPTITVS